MSRLLYAQLSQTIPEMRLAHLKEAQSKIRTHHLAAKCSEELLVQHVRLALDTEEFGLCAPERDDGDGGVASHHEDAEVFIDAPPQPVPEMEHRRHVKDAIAAFERMRIAEVYDDEILERQRADLCVELSASLPSLCKEGVPRWRRILAKSERSGDERVQARSLISLCTLLRRMREDFGHDHVTTQHPTTPLLGQEQSFAMKLQKLGVRRNNHEWLCYAALHLDHPDDAIRHAYSIGRRSLICHALEAKLRSLMTCENGDDEGETSATIRAREATIEETLHDLLSESMQHSPRRVVQSLKVEELLLRRRGELDLAREVARKRVYIVTEARLPMTLDVVATLCDRSVLGSAEDRECAIRLLNEYVSAFPESLSSISGDGVYSLFRRAYDVEEGDEEVDEEVALGRQIMLADFVDTIPALTAAYVAAGPRSFDDVIELSTKLHCLIVVFDARQTAASVVWLVDPVVGGFTKVELQTTDFTSPQSISETVLEPIFRHVVDRRKSSTASSSSEKDEYEVESIAKLQRLAIVIPTRDTALTRQLWNVKWTGLPIPPSSVGTDDADHTKHAFKYLGQRYSIVLNTSLHTLIIKDKHRHQQMLRQARSASNKPGGHWLHNATPSIVVGSPSNAEKPLVRSENEAHTIAALVRGRAMLEADATWESVTTSLSRGRPPLVHFANQCESSAGNGFCAAEDLYVGHLSLIEAPITHFSNPNIDLKAHPRNFLTAQSISEGRCGTFSSTRLVTISQDAGLNTAIVAARTPIAAAILKHDVPNLFTTINGLEATETSVVLEVFYGLLMTEWKRGWKKEAPAGWGRSNASSAADGSEYGWSGGGGGGSRTPASDDPIEAQNTFVAFAPSAAAESNANTNVLAVSIRRLLPLHTFHPANHTFLTG
eukprot:PhM_4_TR10415/c0_g1_i1/m.22430